MYIERNFISIIVVTINSRNEYNVWKKHEKVVEEEKQEVEEAKIKTATIASLVNIYTTTIVRLYYMLC